MQADFSTWQFILIVFKNKDSGYVENQQQNIDVNIKFRRLALLLLYKLCVFILSSILKFW